MKSAEAEIMDWADDIAYSVHDVEDFYRAGLIPLDRLARKDDEYERFVDEAAKRARKSNQSWKAAELKQQFSSIFLPSTEPYRDTVAQRASLQSFTSELIGRYVRAIRLRAPTTDDRKRVVIDPDAEVQVAMLKQLTWIYVIDNPALAAQQYGQRRVIRDLFDIFLDAASSEKDRMLLPIRCQEALTGQDGEGFDTPQQRNLRVVIDLLASMTEQEALKMHQRLTGVAPGSVLDAVVH